MKIENCKLKIIFSASAGMIKKRGGDDTHKSYNKKTAFYSAVFLVHLLALQFLRHPRLDAACFIFFDHVGLCGFVYGRVEARKKLLSVCLLTRDHELLDLFDYFFVRIRFDEIPRVAASGLSKRFDRCFGDWHIERG